jgi:hypothetical protein
MTTIGQGVERKDVHWCPLTALDAGGIATPYHGRRNRRVSIAKHLIMLDA